MKRLTVCQRLGVSALLGLAAFVLLPLWPTAALAGAYMAGWIGSRLDIRFEVR